MAMKKGEMQDHRDRYGAIMSEARRAHQQGLCREAVELAMSCWEYIDGMMQYERKYEQREFDSIDAIEMVLRYAPVLFDYASLDRLDALLEEKRRIERDTSADMAERLADARSLMWDAHRLWNHLEHHADVRQDQLRLVLGGNQDRWRSIAEAWDKMGLITRKPQGGSYELELSTRLGQVVDGKCSACGGTVEAPKAMFLEKLKCPGCGKQAMFIILQIAPISAA